MACPTTLPGYCLYLRFNPQTVPIIDEFNATLLRGLVGTVGVDRLLQPGQHLGIGMAKTIICAGGNHHHRWSGRWAGVGQRDYDGFAVSWAIHL